MPAPTQHLGPVQSALASFQARPLKEAARQLLDTLGYRSDRTLSGPRSFPDLFSFSATTFGRKPADLTIQKSE